MWEDERTVFWNPEDSAIEVALAMFDCEVKTLAVTGGRQVFDYFLNNGAGYTRFHLSRMQDVYLHGGTKVFSALEDCTKSAQSVLKAAGYVPGVWKELDETASVVSWMPAH